MDVFSGGKYKPCRVWMGDKINEGVSFDRLYTLDVAPEDFDATLQELQDYRGWPDKLNREIWHEFVDYYKANLFSLETVKVEDALGIDRTGFVNDLTVPSGHTSSWEQFKKHVGLNPASIAEIENSSLWVLRHLSSNTQASGAIRGLVTGSVQSGKTATMEGLVSMAADYRWNFFIILSGTIESLRIQTQNRFRNDLQDSEGVVWRVLDFSNEDRDFESEDLRFGTLMGSDFVPDRYVAVCLKNPARLRRLIDFLYSDRNRASKLRLLIIDDEADQAGINTADITPEAHQERTIINGLIVNLVNGRMADGKQPPVPLQAINYVSFTATPYANVLNEASEESLYPRDFVCALTESNEYFGPTTIFGYPSEGYPGLEVVRSISKTDEALLKKLHDEESYELPDSMKDSVSWFLSAAAVLRLAGHRKPISMLVHTSPRVRRQEAVFDALKGWCRHKEEVLERCRIVYESEISAVTREDLHAANPDYPDLDRVVEYGGPFDDISQEVEGLLEDISHIFLDSNDEPKFSSGINFCMDNAESPQYSDESVHLRIIYPNDEQLSTMDKAPVFLVVGGNTLSRGLTLEGLLCSFFARSVSTADTLMQMGRWFGYRRGYELLQRIWMTDEIEEKYEALAKVDFELKRELRRFKDQGIAPSEFGPAILDVAEVNSFTISSKGKTQSAREVSWAYHQFDKETTKFDDDESLGINMEITAEFARGLYEEVGAPTTSTAGLTGKIGAQCWRGVEHDFVVNAFLKCYKLSDRSDISTDIERFLSHLESAGKPKWNVVFVDGPDKVRVWNGIPDVSLGFVNRTKKRKRTEYIDIGSLRDGRHILFDYDATQLNGEEKARYLERLNAGSNLHNLRADVGLSGIPLLLIYLISKDRGVETQNNAIIGTDTDLVGLAVEYVDDSGLKGAQRRLAIDLQKGASDA